MKDKITIALAVLAAFTLNVAANADGCAPVKKISHKKAYRSIKRTVAAKPQLIKETTVTTTKTIEKPVVIEAPAAPAPVAAVEEKKEICQPAVVDAEQPVIIDRFVKRHRSLIHLGLFPFNLFGE